jgi:hypothetical protein
MDAMVQKGTDATVLRADFGAYRRWFGKPIHGLPLIVGLSGGSIASAFRRGDGAVVFVIVAVTIVVALASIAILIATSRVVLTDAHIEYRRGLRRTRLRRDADLVGALAELNASPAGRTSQVLALRARSGGPRIRLNGAYWDQEDLVRVAEAANVPVLDGELTPKDFHRVAPGTMPYGALHPWVFGGGIALVLISLIVAGVFVWFDVKDLPPFDEQPPRAVSTQTTRSQDDLVVALQRVIGGDWEKPAVRLVTCQDGDDYKGWSRRVSVDLAESVVEETGEDVVTTPIAPSRELVDAIGRALVDSGNPEPYVDDADLDDFARPDEGYLEVTSIPDDDDAAHSVVDVTFSGRGGRVSISMYSPCETPGR